MPVKGFTKPTETPSKRYSSDPKTRAAGLDAEDRLGGKQPGAGRPRKSVSEAQSEHRRPAAAAVAQAARDNADAISNVFVTILHDDTASNAAKVRAMKSFLSVEQREAELQLAEARAHTLPDRPLPESAEEAAAQLAAKLSGNPILAERFSAVLRAAGADTPNPPETG